MRKTLTDIHTYWFEGIDDQTVIQKKQLPFVKWFRSSPRLDAEMRGLFGHLFEERPIGGVGTTDDPGWVCYVLLYDQLARNIYRNTPRAYAYDDRALALAHEAISKKQDQTLALIERAFVYMPLMHSEHLPDQELSVLMHEKLDAESRQRSPQNRHFYESNLTYARKYYDIIRQFQRFPHRNVILGRDSTPLEKEFLCR